VQRRSSMISSIGHEACQDGFWLPRRVRQQVLSAQTDYATLSFAKGRPCQPGDGGAVTVRWPQLGRAQWEQLLAGLQAARRQAPSGQAFWDRLQSALNVVGRRLSDPSDPLHIQALATLPGYTGYSESMIRLALRGIDLIKLDQLPAAFALSPTRQAAHGWQLMGDLAGRLRCYPFEEGGIKGAWERLTARRVDAERPLFGPATLPDLVVGYGAGNVPGTALLIALLAQAVTLAGGNGQRDMVVAPPVVVVKNSRREPIFTPLVLSGLEAADPDLVSCLAVLIWDYEDAAIQEFLLSQADLVIAAAGDETIAQIDRALTSYSNRPRPQAELGRSPDRTGRGPGKPGQAQVKPGQAQVKPGQAQVKPGQAVRFHAHGHKVSFSAIGREVLARDLPVVENLDPGQASPLPTVGICDDQAGQGGHMEPPLLDVVTLLAALDSALWDQHGCLSSRIHFVETGGEDHYSPAEYAAHLAAQLRLLSHFLPRGAWPRQQIHDRFDRYKLLEMPPGGRVQVVSDYGEEFLVVVDQRPPTASAFQSAVNDCQGRVIVVRPVADLQEVPDQYLRLLPAANLQSLSVAIGRPGEGLTDRFLRFAEACGQRGVTAIRTVGRGAFPQLAYSWDGLIPLDLTRRPVGCFATIEFDAPYEQMTDTYRLMARLGAAVGIGARGEQL
jgi:hypothetical protein